jgi:hypothetical protein
VNPRTGETVGVMDTGYNQATTDTAVTIQEIAITAEFDMTAAVTVVAPAAGGYTAAQMWAFALGSVAGDILVAATYRYVLATREGYQRAYAAGYQDGMQKRPPRQAPE